MRCSVGYPGPEEEVEILSRRRQRREDAVTLAPVISRAELGAMQGALESVHVAAVIERYIVDLVQATRADPRVALGASPRGTLALLKLARAAAALDRRDFVLPDDVKAMAGPALAHRLILKPELWAARIAPAQVVESLLEQVPAPGPDAPRAPAHASG
jgi:MoxR-like ATPase